MGLPARDTMLSLSMNDHEIFVEVDGVTFTFERLDGDRATAVERTERVGDRYRVETNPSRVPREVRETLRKGPGIRAV